jgi:hypothetical protein
MRPVTYTLSAAGAGLWIPLDYISTPFNVGIGVTLTPGAVLTYTVEHTFDDLFDRLQIAALSRVAGVATLDFLAAHGLRNGDWVGVDAAGAPFDTELGVVTVVDADTITYPVVNSGPLSVLPASFVRARKARVFPHEFLVSQTANQDGNYAFACRATRLNVTAYTGGSATLAIVQSGPN